MLLSFIINLGLALLPTTLQTSKNFFTGEKGDDKSGASKDIFQVNDEYYQIILAFGYVAMFTTALPPIPLVILFKVWVDGSKDSFRLRTKCRRPLIDDRSNIGPWIRCIEAMCILSILTNCYLLTMESHGIHEIFPTAYKSFLESKEGHIFTFLLIEHVMIVLNMVLTAAIDKVPEEVRRELAIAATKESTDKTNELVSAYETSHREINIKSHLLEVIPSQSMCI